MTKNKAMNSKLSNSVVVTSDLQQQQDNATSSSAAGRKQSSQEGREDTGGGLGSAAIRLRKAVNANRNDGFKLQSNTGENYQKLSLLKQRKQLEDAE